MSWYLAALRKYAVFGGRSRRKEYWYYVLFSIIIGALLAIIDNALGTYVSSVNTGLLRGIYSLATLVPSVAVGVRRLHDTDRSGWWLLLLFVPIIGALVLLVLMVQDGTPGSNRYGPNPKEAGAGQAAST